jgi:hypothetical protein
MNKELAKKYFVPHKSFGYFFLGLLLIVLFIGIINFPFSSVMGGRIDGAKMNLGWPWIFSLDFSITENGQIMNFWNFLFDIFVLLLISYVLDIVSYFLWIKIKKSFSKKPVALPPGNVQLNNAK